jgi:hypothetical protein
VLVGYILRSRFAGHQAELAALGAIVLGYTEAEFELVVIVSDIIGDVDEAIKILFRKPGEWLRLSQADGVLRPALAGSECAAEWDDILSSMHKCREFRNNYAHALFEERGGVLSFIELSNTAKIGDGNVMNRVIDLALISSQEDYLTYTHARLVRLRERLQIEAGQRTEPALNIPPDKIVSPPPQSR